MKRIIPRILSTAVAALMLVNVFSMPILAESWDASQIQSQTTYVYSANNISLMAQTYGYTAGSMKLQTTTRYTVDGSIQTVQNADGTFVEVRHFNTAGNLESRDMASVDKDGNPIVTTTYYLAGGVTVTVNQGTGSKLTADGCEGGTCNMTAEQMQSAFDQVVAGATWKDLGVNIFNISMSGAEIMKLGGANSEVIARLFGISTSVTSGTTSSNSGFKVGDSCTDGGTITGWVEIDGTVYGLSSKGNLIRKAGTTNQAGSWGTWSINDDGDITVKVTHNTMVSNAWLGEATISSNGTVTITHTDQGNDEVVKRVTAAGGGFSTSNSSIIINGSIYQYDSSGNLMTSDGTKVGTYNSSTGKWLNTFGAQTVANIMQAAEENPYSTFSVQFGSDGKASTMTYFSKKLGTVTINLKETANSAKLQTDPLVTGTINQPPVEPVTDANGNTHYYISVNASQIDMFDNLEGESYMVDGETIMIEVDRGTYDLANAHAGEEITIAGNVTKDQNGHLAINATSAATQQNVKGYKQDVVIGAVGTTLAAWHASAQNSNYFTAMVKQMMSIYSSLGILDSGIQAKWDALRGNSAGARFVNPMGKRVQTGIQPNF